MKTVQENHPQDAGELQFITKSVGILAIMTGLAYLRAVGVESMAAWRTNEHTPSVLLFALLVVAMVGLLIAWWREGLGGFIAAFSAVGVGIFAFTTYQQNRFFTAFAYSSPFLITGILFLCCWWRQQHKAR